MVKIISCSIPLHGKKCLLQQNFHSPLLDRNNCHLPSHFLVLLKKKSTIHSNILCKSRIFMKFSVSINHWMMLTKETSTVFSSARDCILGRVLKISLVVLYFNSSKCGLFSVTGTTTNIHIFIMLASTIVPNMFRWITV